MCCHHKGGHDGQDGVLELKPVLQGTSRRHGRLAGSREEQGQVLQRIGRRRLRRQVSWKEGSRYSGTLLAQKTGRPVHYRLDERGQWSSACHRAKALFQTLSTADQSGGTILAVEATIYGASGYSGAGATSGHALCPRTTSTRSQTSRSQPTTSTPTSTTRSDQVRRRPIRILGNKHDRRRNRHEDAESTRPRS